jgi:hypothetical protein
MKEVGPRIFRWNELNSAKKWDLEHSGYYVAFGRDLKGEMQNYLFKPFFHESARHKILVYEIARYLKTYKVKVKTFLTVRPDIIFEIDGEEWAFEIETGVILKKNRKIIMAKVKSLKENYGRRWFFVVTDRNCLKSYQRYGKTLTKRNIAGKIDKIMRKYEVAYLGEKEPSECENNFW